MCDQIATQASLLTGILWEPQVPCTVQEHRRVVAISIFAGYSTVSNSLLVLPKSPEIFDEHAGARVATSFFEVRCRAL